MVRPVRMGGVSGVRGRWSELGRSAEGEILSDRNNWVNPGGFSKEWVFSEEAKVRGRIFGRKFSRKSGLSPEEAHA